MGLFGKVFEKKYCDICGNEIKLLGNRKLEDGNLCKECANKLSPWFSERRQSTIDEIKQQLEYREANKEEVANFNVTRTLGKDTKVLLDEDSCKLIVTRSSDYKNSNPDVLDFSMITGCDIDVNESRSEIRFRTEEGRMESYHPEQYDYSYDIYVTIYVNHPYFTQMRFRINEFSISIKNPFVKPNQPPHGGPHGGPHDGPHHGGMMERDMPPFIPHPEDDREYQECYDVALDIKDALDALRETTRTENVEVNKSKAAVVCPNCGATTIPDDNGCCEYCKVKID